MNGAFECDGDARGSVGVVRADAGRVEGGSSSEAEGGGELEGEAAFEFGRTEDGILGAAFESDERAAVEVSALGDEIEVRAGAPGAQAPFQATAIALGFPGGADGGIGTGHEADVLFFGVADGVGDESEEVALPKIGPAVEREQVHGGVAEAI